MAKRKCKVCGTVFEKQRPLQFVCSPACGIEYLREQKRKAAIKSEREAKRRERAIAKALRHKLETIPELTKKAQAAFNRYIRLGASLASAAVRRGKRTFKPATMCRRAEVTSCALMRTMCMAAVCAAICTRAAISGATGRA